MYREEVRQLLPDEIARIQIPDFSEPRAHLFKGFVRWSVIWLALASVAGLAYAYFWPSWFLVALAVVFAVFAVGSAADFFESLKNSRMNEAYCNEYYPKAIAENLAHVITVQSDRVAVLYEREDEGHLYLFDVGDNQLYWVHRQDPEPTLGNELWPNSHFEIITSQSYPVEIGVRGLGTEIQEPNIIELDHADFDFDDFCVPDQNLVQGTIDHIPKIFSLSNRTAVSNQ